LFTGNNPIISKHQKGRILWLYLKDISTGDFSEALAALVGKDAPGLITFISKVAARPVALFLAAVCPKKQLDYFQAVCKDIFVPALFTRKLRSTMIARSIRPVTNATIKIIICSIAYNEFFSLWSCIIIIINWILFIFRPI
jgi:hypothetical protein